MAFKLKNLSVEKVDFVGEGANPDAHIRLFKSKKGEPAPVKKSSFDDEMKKKQAYKISDEMWDVTYALREALMSIFSDEDEDDKVTAMHESVTQFTEAMADFIPAWCSGKVLKCKLETDKIPEDVRKSIAKASIARLNEIIGDTVPAADTDEILIEEGESNMRVNKSLLTDEEKANLEAILKKAGVSEPDDKGGDKKGGAAGGDGKKKSDPDDDTIEVIEGKGGVKKSAEPVAKSFEEMFPEKAAELEALTAFKASSIAKSKAREQAEIVSVAKKYEILGKKLEDLAKTLTTMKEAGESIYNDYVAALDDQLAAVNKSKMFEEVGMNGHGGTGATAIAKAKVKADEIKKSNPGMSDVQAMAQVWEQNPDLMDEYDAEIQAGG